jgi:cation diffusion facilitator family transporter
MCLPAAASSLAFPFCLLKYFAFILTGSIAFYSDALESVVNVATAVVTLVAVRLSAIPADNNHPYGHHKAEYLSAVLEGVLIVIAVLAILREAYFGFLEPKPLQPPVFLEPKPLQPPVSGLVITAVATLLNVIWGWVLVRNGRHLRSPA